ncbi:hypothetical protein DPX16_17670 [Anabarilius grahami]|uniref:Uncharacterized protein n=1 Tax=Anabarilius grahami TaxID=495550 RepID=A0A3N0YHG3_ANAGA|nr:hypothetical protein DPX16_17670 [Anabarilius grahami]
MGRGYGRAHANNSSGLTEDTDQKLDWETLSPPSKRLPQRTAELAKRSAGALVDCRPERCLELPASCSRPPASVSPAAIRRAYLGSFSRGSRRSKRVSCGPRRSKRAPQTPFSRRRRCSKCRATLVAHAEPLCMTMTGTVSPSPASCAFLPEVHAELTKSWRAPYSARLRTSQQSAPTSVDGSSEKNYDSLPPLDEAVAAHLCPPAAVGWKTKRALPSKPGRAYTSAGQAASSLHTMAILQVFQAKLLRALDESGFDAPAFRDLRSTTDLALRATKATAQAIGQSMASLVVLERHLLLNLTEIKDTDKTAFLDAPVSPLGFFGPAVEGFTERFTTAQKSSQAMRHFLPKRSSYASASSRPRTAPAQQSKPAPSTAQAAPAPKEQRRRARPAKRSSFPRQRQAPRPKIELDPRPPKSS